MISTIFTRSPLPSTLTDRAPHLFNNFDFRTALIEFEFYQYGAYDGYSTFISEEISQAISDGILGIHIARRGGSGNLFLEESKLEV